MAEKRLEFLLLIGIENTSHIFEEVSDKVNSVFEVQNEEIDRLKKSD